MERVSAAARVVRPIDAALLAAAAQRAANAVGANDEPASAIEAVIVVLYEAVAGAMSSVFVLEHGRLWLVAQRGYAVVPDGITVESGVTGRAVRLARAQLAVDARTDPDYVQTLPGVTSELAIPLFSGRAVIGVLNVESERALPDEAVDALRPVIRALTGPTEALRSRRTLDLSALARLFVHLGSLRDPGDNAALAAASLPRVLPVETTQIVVWTELGLPTELAAWTSESGKRPPLSADELDVARAGTDPSVVCQVLELGTARGPGKRSVVWLPLRANAGELGAMVGISGESSHVDPGLLDTAAVLAAHVAASLDAAFALQRERLSAMSDPLTGILNRRGLEERLERELAVAQERVSRRVSRTQASRSGSPPASRSTPSTGPHRRRSSERATRRSMRPRKRGRIASPRSASSRAQSPREPERRPTGRWKVVGAEGRTDPAPFSRTRLRRRRRSTPRARSKASAADCARRSSSASARPRARHHASSATTSSTPPTMRSARCHSGTRRPTGSPTSPSPPRWYEVVRRRRSP